MVDLKSVSKQLQTGDHRANEFDPRFKIFHDEMIHKTCLDAAAHYGSLGNDVKGANIAGFTKVVDAGWAMGGCELPLMSTSYSESSLSGRRPGGKGPKSVHIKREADNGCGWRRYLYRRAPAGALRIGGF